MNYLEGYTLPWRVLWNSGSETGKRLVLMLDYGIFYEFIPLDKYNKNNKESICLKDVSLNTTYVIVISTNLVCGDILLEIQCLHL